MPELLYTRTCPLPQPLDITVLEHADNTEGWLCSVAGVQLLGKCPA